MNKRKKGSGTKKKWFELANVSIFYSLSFSLSFSHTHLLFSLVHHFRVSLEFFSSWFLWHDILSRSISLFLKHLFLYFILFFLWLFFSLAASCDKFSGDTQIIEKVFKHVFLSAFLCFSDSFFLLYPFSFLLLSSLFSVNLVILNSYNINYYFCARLRARLSFFFSH